MTDDPAFLWLANAAAEPARWSVRALPVRHDETDGVVVYGGVRYDVLSRERAAAGLADPKAPANLQAPLRLAAAQGPSFTALPAFPSGLVRVLDDIADMAARGARFRRTNGVSSWVPLPADAWEHRAPPPPDPEPEFLPTWTPDEM